MKTEKEIIKEYLDLKLKYNRRITYINKLVSKAKKDYRDVFRYEHSKMLLYQLELALKVKAKELKGVI